MYRALVIRQEQDAPATAALLQSKGVEPCLHPLFKSYFLPLPSLKNPQGLIITSKNALRALEGREDLKELPLYVVGDQTAQFAKNRGFLKVLSASGTSKELISVVLQKASRAAGILWHLSGDVVRGNIVETLQAEGFDAKRQIVYHMEGVETLPPPLLFDLQNQKITHVLFFSSRTTTLFVNLLKKNGLEKVASHMTSLCLSQDVVKKALVVEWKGMWVSPTPNVQDMMGYFDESR